PQVRLYLQKRELVTSAYREVLRPVRLADGRLVRGLAYVVDEQHEQFAGNLSVEQQLAMVRAGVGLSGRNVDYVLNTAQHLAELGIRDRQLMAIAEKLRQGL
ncbi:MAG TPA: gamma-glutamylcyclotransferase, partial [Devosia sp.]|nr:gamma-glutamylcyclotransferase [Devosia sp.]